MLHNFPCISCCLLTSKLTFSKHSFRNTIRVSNVLDHDQDRHFVGPDLGPKPFAKITTRRQKSLLAMEELMVIAKNLYTRNVLTWEMFDFLKKKCLSSHNFVNELYH